MRVLGTKQEDLAKVCFDGVLKCTFIDQNVSDPVFNPVRIERIVTVVVIVVLVRDPEISTTTVLYSRRSCLALCTHSSFVSCETRGHSTRCWLALDRDSYRLESVGGLCCLTSWCQALQSAVSQARRLILETLPVRSREPQHDRMVVDSCRFFIAVMAGG